MVDAIPSRYNSRINLNLAQDPLIDQTEDPVLYQELLSLHNAIEALTQGDTEADADLVQLITKVSIDNAKLRSIVSKLAGNSLNFGVFVGNSRVITQLSDFEDYTDTEVFLADGVEYIIRGDVDISPRRLTATEVQFNGSGAGRSILRSDVNGGAMLTTVGDVDIKNLRIEADGTAEVLDCTGLGIVNIADSSFRGGAPGEINMDAGSAVIVRFAGLDVDVSPLRFGGTYIRIDFDEFFPTGATLGAGDTFIDFITGIVITERIAITKALINMGAGSVGYNFQDITNLSNEGVQIQDCTFFGVPAGTPVVGLLPSDNEAFFKDNVGLTSSFPNAGWGIQNNATATVIAVIDTPVVINTDNITLSSFTQRFTLGGTNGVQLTYTGAQPRAFTVNVTLVMETAQNNQRIGAQIFINDVGTAIVFSTVTSGAAGTRIENMTLAGAVALAPLDVIDLRLFNATSTDNIIATDVIFQIASLGT